MTQTVGGRVSIVLDGIKYSARGELTINPSRISVEVGANRDGSIYKTTTPQPVRAECSFNRLVDVNGTPLKWDESLMLRNNIPITFIEQDTGFTRLISNGTFVGDPQENLATGEVTGVSLAGETHDQIRG